MATDDISATRHGRMSIPPRPASILAAFGIACLGGCAPSRNSVLDPGGLVALSQKHWLFEIIGLLAIIAIPVFVGVPLCVWRYRRKAGGAYAPTWNFSRPLEYLVWGVPCLIVLALSLMVVGPESRYSPYDPLPGGPPLEVEVVALDWKWLFIYPAQHVASVDRLAIPVGVPVRFTLTSDATMQSFWIPSLGSQIYAMAGMTTQLNLRADRPGSFIGRNTQFNGMGFQDDSFDVLVMPQADFGRWIARLQAQPSMDAAAYAIIARRGSPHDAARALARSSSLTGMPSFGDVPDHFMAGIVARYNPSGMVSGQEMR